jgi:hypothetical protein
MKIAANFGKTALISLFWLVICAVVFAIAVAVAFPNDDAPISDRINQALFLFLLFFAFGFLPVLFYGVPVYLYLLRHGWAKWWSALLVGMLPGVAALPMELSLGSYALAAGSAVSLLTHATIARGANNSFKPNPLRGSA